MTASKKRAPTVSAAAPAASARPATASQQQFAATVQTAGTKTYLEIPFDPNAVWGDKDRHYFAGTLDSQRIRGFLVFDGSQFVLSLGPAWLRDNATSPGAKVNVVLEPDGPLLERLEPDIATALTSDAEARRFFESIAPFYRKNAIRWIESAKRAETRASRIAETVRMLRAGKTM
jgi:hypothetical protein